MTEISEPFEIGYPHASIGQPSFILLLLVAFNIYLVYSIFQRLFRIYIIFFQRFVRLSLVSILKMDIQ